MTDVREKLLSELRGHLKEMLRLRQAGVDSGRISRLHGYVDGCMYVLIETGLVNQRELLQLVAEERTLLSGPPTVDLVEEPVSVTAAA